MRKYGFGIIGSGTIAKVHAEHLQRVDGANLVAVSSASSIRTAAFAAAFGCRAHASLAEMLAAPDIDIVTICTPSSTHAELAIACANAGKHAIVEKPMAVSLEKADAMIHTFRSRDKKLGVVLQHRFDSSTERVKALIERGSFGRLVVGTAAINWYRSQSYYDDATGRGTWQWDGGGALMNQGIHTIDLLQHLMGPVASVYAHCANLGHERIEVEDTAVASLRFRSGALGTIVGTTSAFPGLCTRIEVLGTAGSAVIENDSLRLCKYRGEAGEGGVQVISECPENAESSTGRTLAEQGFGLQFANFIRAVDANCEPAVNGSEGRSALEIILAAYESSRCGKEIHLPASSA